MYFVKENEKGIARSFVVLFTIFIIILLFFIIRQGKEALPLRPLPLANSQVGKKATGIIIIIILFSSSSLSVLCLYGSEVEKKWGRGREEDRGYLTRKKGENCKSGASRSVGPELSTA